jgi:hypothetical protein
MPLQNRDHNFPHCRTHDQLTKLMSLSQNYAEPQGTVPQWPPERTAINCDSKTSINPQLNKT